MYLFKSTVWMTILLITTLGHAAQKTKTNDIQELNKDLFKAITAYDRAQVEKLIQAGADVNARDEEDKTPLMYAAIAAGDKDIFGTLRIGSCSNKCDVLSYIIDDLCDAGADMILKDKNNVTVFGHIRSYQNGFAGNTEYLLGRRFFKTPDFVAWTHEDWKKLAALE